MKMMADFMGFLEQRWMPLPRWDEELRFPA